MRTVLKSLRSVGPIFIAHQQYSQHQFFNGDSPAIPNRVMASGLVIPPLTTALEEPAGEFPHRPIVDGHGKPPSLKGFYIQSKKWEAIHIPGAVLPITSRKTFDFSRSASQLHKHGRTPERNPHLPW